MPYPPRDGGSLATYNMARGLAEAGNRVDLLAMNTAKHHVSSDDILTEIPGSVKSVAVYVDNRVNYFSLLYNLIFTSRPYNSERYISIDFKAMLAKILNDKRYDLVQLEGLYLAPYIDTIREFSDAVVAYRAHNVEHRIWEKYGQRDNNPLKKWYIDIQYHRIMRLEQWFINQYDMLVAITENDLEIYNKMGNIKPGIVATFGMYDDQASLKRHYEGDVYCLQFIGALDWLPNIEALEWFFENVWEELKRRRPSLRFYVAGRNAGPELAAYLRKSGADFVGEVKNSGEFLSKPGILVVPLFSGSGVRVRVVEAMYFGKPIVASREALSGISYENGIHLFSANDPDRFIVYIGRLLDKPADGRAMGMRARELALKSYNNRTITENLTGFYKKYTA